MTDLIKGQNLGLWHKFARILKNLWPRSRKHAAIDFDNSSLPASPALEKQVSSASMSITITVDNLSDEDSDEDTVVVSTVSRTITHSYGSWNTDTKLDIHANPANIAFFRRPRVQTFGRATTASTHITTLMDCSLGLSALFTTIAQDYTTQNNITSNIIGAGYFSLPLIIPMLYALIKKPTQMDSIIENVDIIVHSLGLLARLISGVLLIVAVSDQEDEDKMGRYAAGITVLVDMLSTSIPLLAKHCYSDKNGEYVELPDPPSESPQPKP